MPVLDTGIQGPQALSLWLWIAGSGPGNDEGAVIRWDLV
jgi:hypothetical protein